MSRDTKLKDRWELLVKQLSDQFAEGEDIDLDGIIYLIGVQELGQIHREFKKDEKLNLMHIAICRLLEPYGYYEFEGRDKDQWPHFKLNQLIPALGHQEEQHLMKEAMIDYFTQNDYYTPEETE